MNTATYALSYQYARVAIDLALARGGDQAVIKDCNGITYFGGKKEQTAKNTRVKARVKAEALREFIVTRDKVIVMGHKIAASGMPKTTWCREHGISDKSFFYWQRILREEAYLTTLERARLGRRWILASL